MVLAGDEVYTLSILGYVAYNFWSNLNFVKLYKYIANYINFYNIKSMLLVKFSFILYTFSIANVDIFYNILSQIL
jgi:hypothetical protein